MKNFIKRITDRIRRKPLLVKPAVISSCDLDKKKRALEYIKLLHYGFKDSEYEMAIIIGDWECNFEVNIPYYSKLEQETYYEQQEKYQGAMIVHSQRLPFLGRIETPTGVKMSIPVKNIHITKHEYFTKTVDDFFYKMEFAKIRPFNY